MRKLDGYSFNPVNYHVSFCDVFYSKFVVEYFIPKKMKLIYFFNQIPDEEENRKKKKRRLARHFTEGWVEFESKRAAKRVAQMLNNTPIATRKSSKFYDISWVMKYLPRFKWVHLSERLTYERAVHRQKLQTEISQARKETAFFQENLDKSDKFKKFKKKQKKASNFVETKE